MCVLFQLTRKDIPLVLGVDNQWVEAYIKLFSICLLRHQAGEAYSAALFTIAKAPV